MSFRYPSHVSATTGKDPQSASGKDVPCFSCQAITSSRTTPTLCVLVIITGPYKNPDSVTQEVPVISPFPFSVNHPANTGSTDAFPRGKTAVTPVRPGPLPTSNFPSPEITVRYPTSTPFTSVIEFSGPGTPSKGTPKSRARGTVCENAGQARTTAHRADPINRPAHATGAPPASPTRTRAPSSPRPAPFGVRRLCRRFSEAARAPGTSSE